LNGPAAIKELQVELFAYWNDNVSFKSSGLVSQPFTDFEEESGSLSLQDPVEHSVGWPVGTTNHHHLLSW